MKKLLVIIAVAVSGFVNGQTKYKLSTLQVKQLDSLQKIDVNYTDIANEFFILINKYRSNNNLSQLTRNSDIDTFAYEQVMYMATASKVTHDTDKLTSDERINQFKKYNIISENVASGSLSLCLVLDSNNILSIAEMFFTKWKNSIGHNKNMLVNGVNLKIGISFFEKNNIIYGVMTIGQ